VTRIIIDDVNSVRLGGHYLLPTEIERLALADGFSSAIEFVTFFKATYGLTFRGELIKW
jgi:hypothetical protein